MKKTIIILLIVFGNIQLIAQDFKHEIGIKSGYPYGITYRYNTSDESAYEFMLTYRQRGLQLTALIEQIKPLEFKYLDNLYYYSGMGVHIGYTTKRKDNIFHENLIKYYPYDDKFRPVLGMDAIFGIEYRLYDVPFNIAMDVKPYFEIFGQPFFDLSLWDISLTIKYKFN